jgi:hypothetical protein
MPNDSGDVQNRRERRRYKRIRVLMAAELVSAQRATGGLIFDISANGAQIQFPEPLVPDSAMTLRLAETVDLGVEIVWRNRNRLGLRFRDLPSQISSIFAGLLPEDSLAAT